MRSAKPPESPSNCRKDRILEAVSTLASAFISINGILETSRYDCRIEQLHERTIVAKPTATSEPSTDLRTEIQEQIDHAQAELASHIDELRRAASAGGDASTLGIAEAQRDGLARLQRRIDNARPSELASIRAEVAAIVTAAQFVAQQTRSATNSAEAAHQALHAASTAARHAVTSFMEDYFDKKVFDPYLRFTSPEDEEAYRKREADREKAIKDALALGTPEGNLRAAQLSKEQLVDAGAHGADRSPDFRPMLDNLDAAASKLETAIDASKPSEVDLALGAEPTPVVTDPLAAAARLLASGVAVSDGNTGHGLTTGVQQTTPLLRV